MSKQEKRMPASQLSRQITARCILTTALYLLLLFGGYFFAWFICSRIVWPADSSLYYILKGLESLSPVLLVAAIILGLFFIMRHYFAQPLQYLDEIIAAAKQLTLSPETPVSLPEAMLDTQNELNLMRERALNSARAAKEAEQRKNDLVVYLAHDLKTPLTSVIGYLTLLRDEPDLSPALRAKYTGIALEKAERLESLINEFFDITRFSLTTLELERRAVNLTRMLEQIIYEFRPLLDEKSLTWNVQLAPSIGLICDPDKLERVFDNLFRNAVNYSYPDSELRVTLEQRDGSAVIQIENHGPTIAPEKLERIFEQFFRVNDARATATGGAGLGLAIAREIVELHGGTILAESANEHIRFTVTLPF